VLIRREWFDSEDHRSAHSVSATAHGADAFIGRFAVAAAVNNRRSDGATKNRTATNHRAASLPISL